MATITQRIALWMRLRRRHAAVAPREFVPMDKQCDHCRVEFSARRPRASGRCFSCHNASLCARCARNIAIPSPKDPTKVAETWTVCHGCFHEAERRFYEDPENAYEELRRTLYKERLSVDGVPCIVMNPILANEEDPIEFDVTVAKLSLSLTSKRCFKCGSKDLLWKTLTKRKPHCTICLESFCRKCVSKIEVWLSLGRLGNAETITVCDECRYEVLAGTPIITEKHSQSLIPVVRKRQSLVAEGLEKVVKKVSSNSTDSPESSSRRVLLKITRPSLSSSGRLTYDSFADSQQTYEEEEIPPPPPIEYPPPPPPLIDDANIMVIPPPPCIEEDPIYVSASNKTRRSRSPMEVVRSIQAFDSHGTSDAVDEDEDSFFAATNRPQQQNEDEDSFFDSARPTPQQHQDDEDEDSFFSRDKNESKETVVDVSLHHARNKPVLRNTRSSEIPIKPLGNKKILTRKPESLARSKPVNEISSRDWLNSSVSRGKLKTQDVPKSAIRRESAHLESLEEQNPVEDVPKDSIRIESAHVEIFDPTDGNPSIPVRVSPQLMQRQVTIQGFSESTVGIARQEKKTLKHKYFLQKEEFVNTDF